MHGMLSSLSQMSTKGRNGLFKWLNPLLMTRGQLEAQPAPCPAALPQLCLLCAVKGALLLALPGSTALAHSRSALGLFGRRQ